ncbi:hypothetical protein NP233_g1428 [Leucocoprinus birnbaumii]|uniref:Uncharacterized protein n=1 Tax=Leucocoprinus birnbaumii TaxID=56174 RepID=A0AAD5W439_9AGAR|nr:hypothetical protein NP233_g1428 [Leucocoprinus birnbaumii]
MELTDERVHGMYRRNSEHLGTYPHSHALIWQQSPPVNYVIHPSDPSTPLHFVVVGTVNMQRSHLGPVGDHGHSRQRLSTSEHVLTLERPKSSRLSSDWKIAVQTVKRLQTSALSHYIMPQPIYPPSSLLPPFDEVRYPLLPPAGEKMTFRRPVFVSLDQSATGVVDLCPRPDPRVDQSGMSRQLKADILKLYNDRLRFAHFNVTAHGDRPVLLWRLSDRMDGALVAVRFQLLHTSAFQGEHFTAFMESVHILATTR